MLFEASVFWVTGREQDACKGTEKQWDPMDIAGFEASVLGVRSVHRPAENAVI